MLSLFDLKNSLFNNFSVDLMGYRLTRDELSSIIENSCIDTVLDVLILYSA